MKVRRHLRLWTALSLVLQSAWLFALVPWDCCDAHKPSRTDGACHEEVRAVYCPMVDGSGAACPMHQGTADHSTTPPDCTMRGSCRGQMSGLISLLSGLAVLTGPQQVEPSPAISARAAQPREQLTSRFFPPESPPPRL